MTVRYHTRHGELLPEYACQRQGVQTAVPACQRVPGAGIDAVVGEILLAAVTPVALEVALQVQTELEARSEEADALRRQQVERTRYEAEVARRRYMAVDPDNRLVADALEAEWNCRLRDLAGAQESYDRAREADRRSMSEEQRARIHRLATDFPALWRDPKTPQRERKRMVRLLVEDVTLVKADDIKVHVRFKGGQTTSVSVPIPRNAWQLRQTAPEVIAEVDRLLDHHTDSEIAVVLNQRGFLSGEGKGFHRLIVRDIRWQYGLKSRYDRLRDAGMLTAKETAEALRVAPSTVATWRRHGLLRAHRYNDKGGHLFERVDGDAPTKRQGAKLAERRRFPAVLPIEGEEVQCGA